MYQILSLEAEGLFHRAIGESGTPIGHLNNLYRTAEEDYAEGLRYMSLHSE